MSKFDLLGVGLGEGIDVSIVVDVRFVKGFIIVGGFLGVFLLRERLFNGIFLRGLIFSRFVRGVVVVDVGVDVGGVGLFRERRFNNMLVFFVECLVVK